MTIRLISVNRSQPREIVINGQPVMTGICKVPAEGKIRVGRLGLDGDVQVDQMNHGGPGQALYACSVVDYDWFSASLGRPLAPGLFGENLILSNFGVGPLCVGDRLAIGDVLLEVTGPRIPCSKFATRMDDPHFIGKFVAAERPGAYLRVLSGGEIGAGADVRLERGGGDVDLVTLFRAYYDRSTDPETLRRILAAPIAERARPFYEKRLAGALGRDA